jgi:hypothetical protein
MSRRQTRAEYRLVLAAIAFGISAASFFGFIMPGDAIGRFVFGTTWSMIGVWWLGRFLDEKKPSTDRPQNGLRPPGP